MKLFVVLALLGFCYGRDFCTGSIDELELEVTFDTMTAALGLLITDDICPEGHKAATTDQKFFHPGCKEAVLQGWCFAKTLYEDFVPEGDDPCLDEDKRIDTYTKMAKFATNYIGTIGESACADARPCLEQAVGIIAGCAETNEYFFENVTAQAFKLLNATKSSDEQPTNEPSDLLYTLQMMMERAQEMFMCEYGDDADAQCLIDMATMADPTMDDVKGAIDSVISYVKANDVLLTEAQSFSENADMFFTKARQFCNTGCVSKTTSFFTQWFVATDDPVTCPSTLDYCNFEGEGCQKNAEDFLSWYPKITPCCTKVALADIMTAFNYAKETYLNSLQQLESYVLDTLKVEEECGGAVSRYDEYLEEANRQAMCLKETYGIIEDGCCTKCPANKKCNNKPKA